MIKIEINGIEVEVVRDGVKKYGYDNLFEIKMYPHLETYTNYTCGVRKETDDWVVLETEELKVYMNNVDGYIIFIEFEKSHYERDRGLVIDKEAHIYYTRF